VTKVRIFSLEDVTDLPLAQRERSMAAEPREGSAVAPRKREETAARRHVFLSQTIPPNDPLVREIERRRSGLSEEGEEELE
jgi:hypothetical protein